MDQSKNLLRDLPNWQQRDKAESQAMIDLTRPTNAIFCTSFRELLLVPALKRKVLYNVGYVMEYFAALSGNESTGSC